MHKTNIILAVTAVLSLSCVLGAQAGKTKHVKLKSYTMKVAAELPLATRRVISEHLPVELVGEGYSAIPRKGKLEVDTTGDGRRNEKISGYKPEALKIGADSPRSILVFKLFETWYAAPASAVVCRHGRRVITLLDANLDGSFDGPEDYIRIGGGSFHRQDPIHLLAENDLLLRYQFDAAKMTLGLTPVAKPDAYNPLQWLALQTANHFRSHVGLPPYQLNPDRCDGCQKHARYLQLNNYDYSAPWDGVGSHDERPGKPGYTEEGLRAAHSHGTSGTGDAASSILGQTRTMLHRTGFLGPVAIGLGVGAVGGASDGYSVVGGGKPTASTMSELVVVPAPGQRKVYRFCGGERPYPDRNLAFYDQLHGYPISVSHGRVSLSEATIEVFERKGKRLHSTSGSVFSVEKPISKTRPSNARTTFFVSDKGLDSKTTYLVRFRAKHGGAPVEVAWEFTTR